MNADANSHYNRPRRHASWDSQRNPARPERPPALNGPRRPALGAGAAGGLNAHLCSLALTPGRCRWGGMRPETGSAGRCAPHSVVVTTENALALNLTQPRFRVNLRKCFPLRNLTDDPGQCVCSRWSPTLTLTLFSFSPSVTVRASLLFQRNS
jgi:hypothetical protein